MNKVLVLDLALKEGESSALLQGFRLNQYLFAQFGSLREKKLSEIRAKMCFTRRVRIMQKKRA